MSILSPLRAQQHLDDRAIAALWSARATAAGDDLTRTGGPSSDGHIDECARCRARYDAFVAWLADTRAEAIAEADELFSAERLALQQAHIARRLEALERPARVIAFPRGAQGPLVVRRNPQRWIAAAAAAGLVVGLGAGELRDFGRSMRSGTPAGSFAGPPPAPLTQTAAVTIQPAVLSSDDAFLYEAGDAGTSSHVEALQALDALTPLVRDMDQVQ